MEKIWTPNEVTKLFRITKTKTTLLRDEANKTIPQAIRVKRGSSFVRAWKKEDLPQIGRVHGFLKPPQKTKIISIYTAKGGVLKTTIIDLKGAVVKEELISNGESVSKSISLKGLKQGLYLVKIQNGSLFRTAKLSIQ